MDIKDKIKLLLKEEEMTFSSFKTNVEKAYSKYFPKSTCIVKLSNTLGSTIWIACYLAKDNTESINKILNNDILSVSFFITLKERIDENSALPDKLILEVSKNWIYTKPKEGSFNAYDSYKLPFRKSTATPDKIITTLDKYFKTLHDVIKTLVKEDKIHSNHIDLVKKKI